MQPTVHNVSQKTLSEINCAQMSPETWKKMRVCKAEETLNKSSAAVSSSCQFNQSLPNKSGHS